MADDDKKNDDVNKETKADPRDEKIKALEEKLNQLDKMLGSKKETQDDDLVAKAKKQREADDKQSVDAKTLEAAIRFSVGADSWIKTNKSLLPKETEDIFKAAEKENFSSPVEKDAAIKSGIIQSFFNVQSNLDLLTPALKNQLDDYLKLTKTGKQEAAQKIYDAIFEPTFEMLKRIKKTEALQKGHGTGDDDSYKKRMMDLSKKHYLGV